MPNKTQQRLIRKIKDKRYKQKDIAKEYIIATRLYIDGLDLNWPVINRAIIDRWSRSGLERVKEMAWKQKT